MKVESQTTIFISESFYVSFDTSTLHIISNPRGTLFQFHSYYVISLNHLHLSLFLYCNPCFFPHFPLSIPLQPLVYYHYIEKCIVSDLELTLVILLLTRALCTCHIIEMKTTVPKIFSVSVIFCSIICNRDTLRKRIVYYNYPISGTDIQNHFR